MDRDSAATMNTEDPLISPSKRATAAVVEASISWSADPEDPALALDLALAAVAALATVTTATTTTAVALARDRIKRGAFHFMGLCAFSLVSSRLPFLDLAWCGLFNSDNLVTVQQTERIIGQFQLKFVC
jgi:hypothetical protein